MKLVARYLEAWLMLAAVGLASGACGGRAGGGGNGDSTGSRPVPAHAVPAVAPELVRVADGMAWALARPADLPGRPGPRGARVIDLRGGYQHVLVLAKQPGGAVGLGCVDSRPAMEAALVGRLAGAVRE